MLKSRVSILAGALSPLFLAVALPGAAQAATIYETASYTGDDTGEYIVQNGHYMGAAFTLTQTTDITAVGGQFGGYPSGTIYAAIIPLASLDALPAATPGAIAGISLGHTVFAVTSGTHDQAAALPLTLAAGAYAVVFGSGEFGASGWAGFGDLNTPVGQSHMFASVFSSDWSDFDDTGVRIFVEGNAAAIPEPATWAMLIAGFGLVGGAMRRRARFVAA